MFSNAFATAALLTFPATLVRALDNGFGVKPVLGFNTYNDVGCSPNETYVSATINAFSQKGFKDAGYEFFQVDCGWQGFKRQSNGSLTYDSSTFPNGIAPLSKQARNLGFQWSMYTNQGIYSCDTRSAQQGLRPGSLGYERQDALQFAGWNVAYMKVDNCYIDGSANNAPKDPRTDFPERFQNMSTNLQNVGIKGMLVCQWGTPYQSPTGLQGPAEWTPPLANSYRISDDITQGWAAVMRITSQTIHVNLRGLSGPGQWADMDLLEVGNPGMSTDEQASHFAIWAMFKSALMVSTPVPSMSDTTRNILLNKDLLAINQDAGQPVKLVQRFTNDRDVYAGSLSNGDRAVLLLDQTNTARTLSVSFASLGIKSATVKNLWTGQTTTGQTSYSAQVNAHGSLPLRLSNIVAQTVTTPTLNWIEAESGATAGGANVQSCSGCSGGSKVGYIGNDGGSLTFSGIRTSQATQDVRFDYLDCEIGYLTGGTNTRGASISVNGGAGQSVIFPLTGWNWDKDVTKNFLVRLSGFSTTGTNTIKISGLSGNTQYAPDFDRIGVVA